MNSLMVKCRYTSRKTTLCSFHSKYAVIRFLPRMPVIYSEFLQFVGSLCFETQSRLTVKTNTSTKANGCKRMCWPLRGQQFVVELQIIENEIAEVILIRETHESHPVTNSFGYRMESISVHKLEHTCRDSYRDE